MLWQACALDVTVYENSLPKGQWVGTDIPLFPGGTIYCNVSAVTEWQKIPGLFEKGTMFPGKQESFKIWGNLIIRFRASSDAKIKCVRYGSPVFGK